MAYLIEKDADVYRQLCYYVNNNMNYPGADQMAKAVGYKTGQSIRDSLNRLEAAGHIKIEGQRQIKSILIMPAEIRLFSRPRIGLQRRFN